MYITRFGFHQHVVLYTDSPKDCSIIYPPSSSDDQWYRRDGRQLHECPIRLPLIDKRAWFGGNENRDSQAVSAPLDLIKGSKQIMTN